MQPEPAVPDSHTRYWKRRALLGAIVVALLGSCMGPQLLRDWQAKQQRERAYSMWQERCKKSGEFIYRTVGNVEGVYLVNVRTYKENHNQGEQPEDQFRLSDPYGEDVHDDGYVGTFLKGFFGSGEPKILPDGARSYPAFGYVEAHDPTDGKLYRYTGRVDQPSLRDKNYGEWVREFVLDRTPISQRTARYGVKFEDISTREEREHWIAGSSLKVIDLQTQEVIAERIGYMVDWAQGSRAGGRSPWLLATDSACPAFAERRNGSRIHAVEQLGQTVRFVEKALKPLNQGSTQP